MVSSHIHAEHFQEQARHNYAMTVFDLGMAAVNGYNAVLLNAEGYDLSPHLSIFAAGLFLTAGTFRLLDAISDHQTAAFYRSEGIQSDGESAV